jgi:hypothetical protein
MNEFEADTLARMQIDAENMENNAEVARMEGRGRDATDLSQRAQSMRRAIAAVEIISWK